MSILFHTPSLPSATSMRDSFWTKQLFAIPTKASSITFAIGQVVEMSHWKLLKILQRKHMKIRDFREPIAKKRHPSLLWAVRYQETATLQETNELKPEKIIPFENFKKKNVQTFMKTLKKIPSEPNLHDFSGFFPSPFVFNLPPS